MRYARTRGIKGADECVESLGHVVPLHVTSTTLSLLSNSALLAETTTLLSLLSVGYFTTIHPLRSEARSGLEKNPRPAGL